MTDYNTKNSLGSLVLDYDLFAAGTYFETLEVLLDAATAGYVPANGDVLCYDTADTNKHQKYDHTIGTHVVMGVIFDVKEDNTGTPVVKLSYAINCSVHYAALGYVGTQNAAQKLAMVNAMRANNCKVVD